MRDAIAAIVALVLLVVAASLATTLQAHRRRRQRQRDSEQALGRRIVAEIPAGDDFLLVSEDASRFYYGEQSIDKDLIVAVRVLINGAPLASYVSRRHAKDDSSATTAERGVGAPAKRDRGAGAPGVIEERGAGVPAERVRGEGAPGVNKDRGVGAPAKRDRGAGAPGVIEERGARVPAERVRGEGGPGINKDRGDRLEGILRDRWDVAVEKVTGTVLVECGAIRERVSQELARKIFDAIKTELEQRDRT
ncbi:MAG: hypothetical protein AUI64_03705 [Acidobacteria bacterium 13_1_40CM_2_64_6]|nr:MAG: hypothetical protein AUI64_03705 [Acidobacteria bacterium 13_1_40CM_2_64_6]